MDKALRKLLRAILDDNLDEVNRLLDSGTDTNFTTSNMVEGITAPLHSAVRRNNLGIVQTLLKHQAFVDVADEDGVTPLYSVLDINIDPRIRKELHAKGTDLNLTNKARKTPLVF